MIKNLNIRKIKSVFQNYYQMDFYSVLDNDFKKCF